MLDHLKINFNGTASRHDFWFNYLFTIGALVAGVFVMTIASMVSKVLAAVFVFAFLALVVFCLASNYGAGARRCRDLGISPWWVLLYMLPLVGLGAFLYFGIAQSKSVTPSP